MVPSIRSSFGNSYRLHSPFQSDNIPEFPQIADISPRSVFGTPSPAGQAEQPFHPQLPYFPQTKDPKPSLPYTPPLPHSNEKPLPCSPVREAHITRDILPD